MKKSLGLLTPLLFGLILLGCGGGIDSGVEGSKRGDELSDAEAGKVCEAVIEYSADALEPKDACRPIALAGYRIAEDAGQNAVAACEFVRDACLKEVEDEPSEPNTRACNAVDSDLLEGCKATVSEIEDCLGTLVDRFSSNVKGIPDCDGLDGYEDKDEEGLPQVCEVVRDECPIALGLAGGLIL